MKNIERFRTKDKLEIALTLNLVTWIVLMMFFALCRLCGWGYFANSYTEQKYSKFWADCILFALKAFEAVLILLTLTKAKLWKCLIIGIAYALILIPDFMANYVYLTDSIYIIIIPALMNKHKQESIGYSILFYVFIFIYQAIMMFSRYTIDLQERFNYLAQTASIIDYKVFILSIFALVALRRKIMDDKIKDLPDIDKKEYGGGGCFLLWGDRSIGQKTFDIFMGIITLGIYSNIQFWKVCKKLPDEKTLSK